MNKISFLASCLSKKAKAAERNISDKPQMDERAIMTMQCIKGKVSPQLFNMLPEMLYSFRKEVQRMMAANLLYFVRDKVATTTGRLDVDTVLEIAYVLIAAEKGLVKKPITNKLAASKLIELAERKTMKEERARIKRELPRVKNVCGIEVRKSCSTCPFRSEESEGMQICTKLGIYVKGTDLCSGWKMAPFYEKVGTDKGKIKKKEYLMFVQMQREQEYEAIERGEMMEEERLTVKELRAMYEQQHGSIWAD